MPYCSVEPGSREVILDRGREHLNAVRRRRKRVARMYTAAQAVHFDHARAVAGEALYNRDLQLSRSGMGRSTNVWYELPGDDPTYLKRKAGVHLQDGFDRGEDQMGFVQIVGAIVTGITTVIAQKKAAKTADKTAKSALAVARLELEAEKARTAQAAILAQAQEKKAAAAVQVAAATKRPGILAQVPGGTMGLGVGVLALAGIWMFTRRPRRR